MNLTELVAMALRSVRCNRLRSALTALGIVIGVSAVVVLVGLGEGMRSGFAAQFGPLDTQIMVSKLQGSVPGGGVARELRDGDVRALADPAVAPHIASVSPVVGGTALASYQARQYRCSLAGARTDYLGMANRTMLAGSFFNQEQVRAGARVVVLGVAPAMTLFDRPPAEAVGRIIRIDRAIFKVIGVVASNGQQDDVAIMPITAARAFLVGGVDRVDTIIVRASSPDTVPAAQDELTTVLDRRHNIREASKRDFSATALGSLLESSNQFLGYLTMFTVAIAGISLIVGAIGIANIMLVAVTERTREIGIRKAIGAPRRAITKQFLIEAVVLSGLGGLVGAGFGVGVVLAGRAVIERLAPNFGAPRVSLPAIAVALGVSLLIGLLAGWYPARRAARMRPIEALRYE